MASSQTSSISLKKKESIIDGCLFVRSIVMNRIESEHEDLAVMEHVVSRIRLTGLYNLGKQHTEVFNELLVEEFYQNALARFHSVKKGGDELIYLLMSVGLRYIEELESFELGDLLTTFWGAFIGNGSDKKEEVSKLASQKKSFGLILNNLLSCLNVPLSRNAKKIGPGKFIGGCKHTAFNKDAIPVNRPSVFALPQSDNSRDVTEKISIAIKSMKRKCHVSDRKSLLAAPENKKHKKAHKPKPTEVLATLVEAPTLEIVEVAPSVAQPTVQHLQGTYPMEKIVTAPSADPEPMAAMMDEQLFANQEGTSETTTLNESVVASPIRSPTPIHYPYPNRLPSLVRDPSYIRVPTPVGESSPKQAPIPVADPNPTETPVTIRSPSPSKIINDTLFSVQVE
ncbi:hypothetical protein OROMI_016387 [Orobanche minor]